MILVNDFNITGHNILLWQAINLGLILIVIFGIWKIYRAITKTKN